LRRLQEDQPIMGILGMDCLRHYCIQLDFADHKIHFFNPDSLETAELGEPLPIKYSFFDALPLIRAGFPGKSNVYWGIDTGCPADVALKSKQLRELQDQTSGQFILTKSIQQSTNGFDHRTFNLAPRIIFNGDACTNFLWSDGLGKNLIGLRYLSRHLATLNFPKRIMYLQPGSTESLAAGDSLTNFLENSLADSIYNFATEATKFLIYLAQKEQLPGFIKSDRGSVNISWHPKNGKFTGYPISETFVLTQKDNVFQRHYLVTQPSKNNAMKLQRAWMTDANEHVIEEYSVTQEFPAP